MLTPASQVLLRSAELLAQGKWLIVNPTDGYVFSELDNSDVHGFHQFFDVYEQSVALANGRETQHQFVAAYNSEAQFAPRNC